MAAALARRPARSLHWRRYASLGLLAAGAALLLAALTSMAVPASDGREATEVAYDPSGPIAQPFAAFGLEGWLVRQPDGSLRAFSATSPFRGCRVDFVFPGHPLYWSTFDREARPTGYLEYLCFSSRWQLDGTLVFGPAYGGLDSFEIASIGLRAVRLDLTRVQLGSCDRGVLYFPSCSLPSHARYGRPGRIQVPLW